MRIVSNDIIDSNEIDRKRKQGSNIHVYYLIFLGVYRLEDLKASACPLAARKLYHYYHYNKLGNWNPGKSAMIGAYQMSNLLGESASQFEPGLYRAVCDEWAAENQFYKP